MDAAQIQDRIARIEWAKNNDYAWDPLLLEALNIALEAVKTKAVIENAVSGYNLRGYIDLHHQGVAADFARHMGVTRQQVNKWLSDGWVVINHQLYSPQRDVPENITGGGSAF